MPKHRFELTWEVPRAGHRWIEVTAKLEDGEYTGPALASTALADSNLADASFFSPEPHPVLFRLFAEIAPDQGGILNFANRYGNLLDDVKLAPEQRDEMQAGPREGVLLSTWQWQINEMRRLIGLWDLIQQEDEEELARHIRWEETPTEGLSVYFDDLPERLTENAGPLPADLASEENDSSELIASATSEPELMKQFRLDEVYLPAKAYLQQCLDPHLFHSTGRVAFGMSWDLRRQHPVLAFHCPSLMSAVWLQFATHVSENLAYGRCRECGRWFEVAPKAARTSRRFCSTSCRSKAYRQRQDRARQMHMAKKTFKEIATELDSDVATVRRWITGQKE